MNKLKTNIVVDILMLVSFAAMSFSGFVLQMRRVFFADRSPFMGMSRHTWSDIHIWSAIVVLVLLVLHILLHCRVVDGFFKKSIASTAVRYTLYLLLVALVLVTVIPWIFAF